MKDSYLLKVNVIRLLFILLLALSALLYHYGLEDYVVLVILTIVVCGVFSVSAIETTRGEIRIRKNYFWAIISINRVILYDQMISINHKQYDIETIDESLQAESFFIGSSKIKWTTTKLTYLENGIQKT